MEQTQENTLTVKQRRNLNAIVWDLDNLSTKQLLYGIVYHFSIEPTMNTLTFCHLIDLVRSQAKRYPTH